MVPRLDLTIHKRRCFLNELMHLNVAWGLDESGEVGIHGWPPDFWREYLADMDLRVQDPWSRLSEGGPGFCSYRAAGAQGYCGDLCDE